MKRYVNIFLVIFLSLPLYTRAAEPEVRGAWLAWAGTAVPSKEKIAQTMDILAAANFNVVYADVWRFGYPYFKSRVFYELTGLYTDPNLQPGRDVLADMIAEGHRAGLEVDAWFEAGFAATTNDNDDLFQARPDWFAQKQDGSYDFFSNGGVRYNWLSHTHPQAQKFLIAMAMEVAKNYDIDGIEFDRVRYPELDCGYDSATVTLYRAEHAGADPPQNTTDAGWMRWRADKLSEFVGILYDSLKSVNPDLVVSNAPLPWGYEQFCQDWTPWINNGDLDIVSTQMYATSNSTYTWRLDREMALVDDDSKLAPGISTEADGFATPPAELVKMIETNRNRGVAGQVIWYADNLVTDPAYTTALTAGVYAESAGLPYRPDNWRLPSIIIHESDSTADRSAGWTAYTGVPGYDGACIYSTSASPEWIEYSAEIPATGWYEIYAYVVRHWNAHKNAQYELFAQSGIDTVYIDQSLEANARWLKLSDVYLDSGKQKILRLTNEGLTSGFLFSDAVMIMQTKRTVDAITNLTTEGKNATTIDEFRLLPAYPNPFNALTTLRFMLNKPADVTVTFYNIRGQQVDRVSPGRQAAGYHTIRWQAGYLPSGLYFYTVSTGDSYHHGKLILIK